MNEVKKWLASLLIVLCGGISVSAFTMTDADTIFTAYNNAFLVGGYYAGWWTGAEEIEMAEDAYDNYPSTARQTIVLNACNQFISHHGSSWTVAGGNFNNYNDDISWAVIAFTRGYQITGNTTFRDVAKNNWDAMYARAWDTNFTGGGLWWSTDNMYKNAAVHGPAAIGACLLYNIYGDSSYLTKAQAIYGWERRVLFNPGNGSIADGITYSNTFTSGGALTYNQGTFIGAANLLYRATGLPNYYQDAVLAGKYTQNSMTSSAGILPEYSSGTDLSGFNGIFARWMARFAKDQNLWTAFGPWLTTNANAAWSVRNNNNLAWQKWATPLGTNVPDSWGCSAAVVVMQVADPSPADALQITPRSGFVVVAQRTLAPNAASSNLVLTNTSAAAINWSLVNTSAWLIVSASSGTLATAGPATNVLVSLVPSATTNLAAGRYYTTVLFTNLSSGIVQGRSFKLIVSAGNAPITLTGFNASIIAPNSATASAPGAFAFDAPNNYGFYQAGLSGGTRGLPPDGAFTSPLDGSSVFQFTYGSTNALVLGYTYPSSATLTLATPQAYNSITLLACSANAASGIGTFVLNFTNGTHSQVFNFNAQDWFGTTNNVSIQGFGRLRLGGSFGPEDNGASNPNLYQTTINLVALGINQPIASITFTKPSGAGAQQTTGIFAVSGAVMPAAPALGVQPQSIANNQPAQGATFSAVATGTPPLAYQWYYSADGSAGSYAPLNDQTNTSLVLNPVLQATNAGSYVMVVTNAYGAVTSSIATLAVYRAPVIVQQPTPANLYVFSGASNTWTMSVNAALPVSYFWSLNGTPISIGASSTLKLTNLQPTNSGNYTVVVSNAFGSVTSSIASLTVVSSPTYPLAQTILADHPLGYWRLDETSGTVAHDYISGNNGIYSSKVLLGQTGDNLVDTHKSARFGFLATSNSCVTNIIADFATTGNATFSVEAWVNGGSQTTDAGLITKGYGNGGEQFNLDCGGGGHAFRFFVRDASGATHAAVSSVVPNNQWHHLVAVCDQVNGHVYLYVDGVNAASGTIGVNTGLLGSALPVSIGARQSGAATADDLQFVGYMEEVAIYKYALSSNQVTAHFVTATNRAPKFFSDPFAVAGITAGQSYSGTLATSASDPNGDTMTFTKVNGPAWLSVSGNGGLSGTPVSSDTGTNVFLMKVTDPGGLSSTATMNLPVAAAPAIASSAVLQGTNLMLNWSGGIAPFQIEQATNLINPVWVSFGAATSANSLSVPATNGAAYYRIRGQ
ncbi:glycoside hydrolase family 76 protein [Pedosphaera parvula]|uniref:Glycoside hydrolase family 76 n=1 Tax=Pedosphaera parvula (strain Ellin514) TaxID=320771 RepID=B9XRA3_PEDPL|nr:glycoside hydrolase family 76 protein [Pedosphaera parvula]EEF57646.1 glycoside hydrolase family 76 [Pedosphaera parvula Ellin514]